MPGLVGIRQSQQQRAERLDLVQPGPGADAVQRRHHVGDLQFGFPQRLQKTAAELAQFGIIQVEHRRRADDQHVFGASHAAPGEDAELASFGQDPGIFAEIFTYLRAQPARKRRVFDGQHIGLIVQGIPLYASTVNPRCTLSLIA